MSTSPATCSAVPTGDPSAESPVKGADPFSRAHKILKAKQNHKQAAERRESFKAGSEGSDNQWEAIPEDVLYLIAERCSPGTLLACRLVCKRWSYHFSAVTKSLKPEKLTLMHRIKAEFKRLERLDLTRCTGLRNRHIEKLAKAEVPIKQLLLGSSFTATSANFTAAQLTNKAFVEVAKMDTVAYLGISHLTGMTNAGLAPLCTMHTLRHLLIAQCRRLTSAAFACIGELPNLKSISILLCHKVDGGLFEHLAKCTSLEKISLDYFTTISPEAVTQLGPLKNLKTLELARVHLETEAISSLPRLTNLTAFGFYKATVPSLGLLLDQLKASFQGLLRLNIKGLGPVDDEVLSAFPVNFPFLQDLKFDLARTTSPLAIEALSLLTGLTSLTMSSLHAHDDTIKAVSHLTTLKVLELPGTHIPIPLLESFCSLKRLEKLGLRRGHVDPRDLNSLKIIGCNPLQFTLLPILALEQLKTVRVLDLSQTTITYAQTVDLISKMIQHGKLEEVILQGCSIAVEGFAHLREMFPSVICRKEEVVRFGGSTLPWDDALNLPEATDGKAW